MQTEPKQKTWDEMEARERDAWVARRIMGWGMPAGYNYWMTMKGRNDFDLHAHKSWSPSTDPTADYQVLERVREAWDANDAALYRQALSAIWESREQAYEDAHGGIVTCYGFLYQPGDWSRAAYEAMNNR